MTFPVSRLTHSGGTLVLRMWAEELRALASKLDALSMSQDKERSALFYASCAIRAAGQKIAKRGRQRDVVR